MGLYLRCSGEQFGGASFDIIHVWIFFDLTSTLELFVRRLYDITYSLTKSSTVNYNPRLGEHQQATARTMEGEGAGYPHVGSGPRSSQTRFVSLIMYQRLIYNFWDRESKPFWPSFHLSRTGVVDCARSSEMSSSKGYACSFRGRSCSSCLVRQ